MRNRLDLRLIFCVLLGLMCGWAGNSRSEPSEQDTHPPSEVTTQENGFESEPADHSVEARPEMKEQEHLPLVERIDEDHGFRFQPAASDAGTFKRLDFGVTGWFSQGQTVWSHNASNLDPNFGDPTSRLKYKERRNQRT